MDAMGFTGVDNTCSINHSCSDDLEESNSVNHGRMEIRRFKMMAVTGVANYLDIAKKRSRCFPDSGNKKDDDELQNKDSREFITGGGGVVAIDSRCKGNSFSFSICF